MQAINFRPFQLMGRQQFQGRRAGSEHEHSSGPRSKYNRPTVGIQDAAVAESLVLKEGDPNLGVTIPSVNDAQLTGHQVAVVTRGCNDH